MLRGMEEELLAIGPFARLSRLSVKQLRHYADLGLLVPAYVDDQTGYRYYRHEQAREALSIGLLRSLDVPLAVIAQVLGGKEDALGGVHERLEADLARRRVTLAALERVMAEGLPSGPVSVVSEPPRRVAVVRETAADTEDLGRATSAAVARLLATAAQAQPPAGPPTGPPAGPPTAPELVGLFPVDFDEPITVTVALVVAEPLAGTELDLLPGGRFARVTHVGPYGQISLTAHALLSWCAERRHTVRGPIREVYVSDPATTPPDRLVTHLMIPLEET